MKYFYYFITILCLYYNPITAPVPRNDCNKVNPYNITLEELLDTLHNNMYWTKRYYGNPLTDFPAGDKKLALTRYKYDYFDKILDVRIYTKCESDLFGRKSKHCLSSTTHRFYIINKKAIFQSAYSVYVGGHADLVLEQGKQIHFKIQSERHIASVPLRAELLFALVYVSKNNEFLIFQDCDQKCAWVQVAQNLSLNDAILNEEIDSVISQQLKISTKEVTSFDDVNLFFGPNL